MTMRLVCTVRKVIIVFVLEAPQSTAPANRPLRSAWVSIGLPLAAVLLAAALAGYGGYYAGTENRQRAAATELARDFAEQFGMAQRDFEGGQPLLALQRLQYIERYAPQYPGLAELLARVRAAGQPTAIAAPATQPAAPATALPTDPAELFAKLQAAYKADDWPAVVQLATALHASAPEYESGTVGAQLFVGLRNRGTAAIENRSLGPGIMWLERAQDLAPLDSGASALLQWAKIYTLANSWWGINWPYAIGQYSELYRAAPNFMDTRVRLRQAYAEYGAQLLSSDACAAQLQFAAALELEAMPELEAQRLAAEQACALLAAAATPAVEETPAATPTPTP